MQLLALHLNVYSVKITPINFLFFPCTPKRNWKNNYIDRGWVCGVQVLKFSYKIKSFCFILHSVTSWSLKFKLLKALTKDYESPAIIVKIPHFLKIILPHGLRDRKIVSIFFHLDMVYFSFLSSNNNITILFVFFFNFQVFGLVWCYNAQNCHCERILVEKAAKKKKKLSSFSKGNKANL